MYAVKIMFMSGPDDGLEVWLKSNQGKGHAIVDGWAFVIGRHEESDLPIPFDTLVSRSHAYLRILSDAIELEDNHSRNGTFFNNRPLPKPVSLVVGSLFRVGQTWIRIQEVRR
jgi:pSer/pThr/pTyr-binding forkhead associated (FHA) protein